MGPRCVTRYGAKTLSRQTVKSNRLSRGISTP
jgi:hypothetical protein